MTNAKFEKAIFANCEHVVLIALCKTATSPASSYICETCEKTFSQKQYKDGYFLQGLHKSKIKAEVMK